MIHTVADLPTLEADLARRADRTAVAGPWDSGSLALLAERGVLGAWIPVDAGGHGADEAELVDLLSAVARRCLTTALVLSQWAAACRLIATAEPAARQVELPALARGTRFTTVGISQLTTSRRHLGTAAVRAALGPDGWRIDGQCPWVTGADRSDTLVTGAIDEAGEQRFFLVATGSPGVVVGPPLELLALSGSRTAAVGLTAVRPVAVITPPAGGTRSGGLATSALALGAAQGALDLLATEADRRPDLVAIVAALRDEAGVVAADLHRAAQAGIEPGPRDRLRATATSLALRASQAALAACKGAGFVSGHPAERLVREACFFLVWSCPPAVTGHVLCSLAGLEGGA
jgi:alkylation response protein AidB-like acyl-CoA dehydrogenase